MKTTASAQEQFKNDLFATKVTGIVIEEAHDGYAKCKLETTAQHMNAVGSVMGGVIFTLADFTFAVASNTEDELVVSMTSQITYLSHPRSSILYAESSCIKEGKRTCSYIITVSDSLQTVVASVSVTGMRLPNKS